MLEFVGRQGSSDLAGEKLSEAFVAQCLRPANGFTLLAAQIRGYCLIVDASHYSKPEQAILRDTIENELVKNPQYLYARQIGQLDKLEVTAVRDPIQRYNAYYTERGLKQGDIKPQSLTTDVELLRTLLAIRV